MITDNTSPDLLKSIDKAYERAYNQGVEHCIRLLKVFGKTRMVDDIIVELQKLKSNPNEQPKETLKPTPTNDSKP